MDELLAIEDLCVDIPLQEGALHPVRGMSLHVARGETVAIVGESGCGKSLTAAAVMGLLPRAAKVSAARMDFAGRPLLGMPARELRRLRGNRMAMILQDPMTSLNPGYTIGNQLIETLRAHRDVTADAARAAALRLLEQVGVSAPQLRLGQYAHQLSGGLRQRVMIAMALICGPDLLIADEPTTALDATVQAQILALLASLQREMGMGMLFITHDLGVVAHIADRVCVMYAGQLVEAGPVAQVLAEPRHPYTEGLLLSIPRSGAGRPGERLATIGGIVPRPFGPLQACVFADRCPYAFADCLKAPIGLATQADRQWRCLLPADRERGGREAWMAASPADAA